MQADFFATTILGTMTNGQGSVNVVEGTPRATLRGRLAKYARGLSLRLGHWHALELKRMPAATTAVWSPAPAFATCPISSVRRDQRRQAAAAAMSGVVVTRGTVGVS